MQAEETLTASAAATFPYQDRDTQISVIERLEAIAAGKPDPLAPTPQPSTSSTPQRPSNGRRQYTDVREFFGAFQRGLNPKLT